MEERGWIRAHNRRRFWLALLAAAVLPALIVILLYARESLSMDDGYGWIRIRGFAILALLTSGGHVLVLGLPSFLLLKTLDLVPWWSAILAGFVLGCIPVGVLTWPLTSWYGESPANYGFGVPTTAGWIRYAESVGYFGMYGAIAGLGFWLVWRGADRGERTEDGGVRDKERLKTGVGTQWLRW